MGKSKGKDELPEHFENIKEASDFWDAHDAGDYEEFLRPLSEQLESADRMPQAVLLESSLSEKLNSIAKRKGISLETLVNLWLSEKLSMSGWAFVSDYPSAIQSGSKLWSN